jgi:hypothetical protein
MGCLRLEPDKLECILLACLFLFFVSCLCGIFLGDRTISYRYSLENSGTLGLGFRFRSSSSSSSWTSRSASTVLHSLPLSLSSSPSPSVTMRIATSSASSAAAAAAASRFVSACSNHYVSPVTISRRMSAAVRHFFIDSSSEQRNESRNALRE